MAKHLARLVMLGGQVVGRAFSRTLRQELAIASSQSAANQRRSANASNDSAANVKLGMSLQEAMQILDLKSKSPTELSPESANKNYEHLLAANDKAKGGSFYLQSKVVRAKERVDEELRRVTRQQ